MLEGQVAVLSSDTFPPGKALKCLMPLKTAVCSGRISTVICFTPTGCYPALWKRTIFHAEDIASSALLQKLLADKDHQCCESGSLREGPILTVLSEMQADLGSALDKLSKRIYGALVQKEKELVLGIFERLFDHQSFTGRSGTFYGYEGLGSIYWHMVSKLLLAVQECYFRGVEEKADPVILGRIKDHYYEIKAGIGLYKSPEVYGAFPTDAYSHTPGNAGVKQPGLTGQVKEDVISRLCELGLQIEDGKISFVPSY